MISNKWRFCQIKIVLLEWNYEKNDEKKKGIAGYRAINNTGETVKIGEQIFPIFEDAFNHRRVLLPGKSHQ